MISPFKFLYKIKTTIKWYFSHTSNFMSLHKMYFFSDPIDQDIRTQWSLNWKIVVSECWSVIAVSLNIGGGIRLIKPAKLYMCMQKHYKYNEDIRTAPSACGNGSVPLSHSGNVVTRIGIHTHTHIKCMLLHFIITASGSSLKWWAIIYIYFVCTEL